MSAAPAPSRRRRTAAALAAASVALVGVVVAAPTASAAPPEPPTPYTEVFEGVCEFPLLYTELVAKVREHVLRDGDVVMTGSYKIRLSNALDESRSVELNATGPFLLRDGIERFAGHSFGLYVEGLDYRSGIFYGSGLVVVSYDPVTGGIASESIRGRDSSDLCALLA